MNCLDYNENIFDSIKHIDEKGNEYWLARELMPLLEYKEWRYFSSVIEKAQIACMQSNNDVNFHFGVYTKIVLAGATTKSILDYKLSISSSLPILSNISSRYLSPFLLAILSAVSPLYKPR